VRLRPETSAARFGTGRVNQFFNGRADSFCELLIDGRQTVGEPRNGAPAKHRRAWPL
jgi:hypothetical protein